MTTPDFLRRVQRMRQLQKRYFQLRREGNSTQAATVLRECKAVETQVDDELQNQIVKCETPKLF